MQDSIAKGAPDFITVSLKRASSARDSDHSRFVQFVESTSIPLLPNTAGCGTAKEAITMALMSREVFGTSLIKVEVIGDDYLLCPDGIELLKACKELIQQDFTVLPYCSDDFSICDRLVGLGCKVLMPAASPIGSGQGVLNPFALKALRERFPETCLIVDSGIGCPSDAAMVMELGFDAVLLNSAVALCDDPPSMAEAFRLAIEAGRLGYLAGRMPKRTMAKASTSLVDTPFIH